MNFFVTNNDYENPSPALASLEDAAALAMDTVLTGQLPVAFVVGMESDTFRTDLPAPMYVKVTALPDLQSSPWA